MRTNNKGYEVERLMKKKFKGFDCPEEYIDFKTSKANYEVKSCELLVFSCNKNSHRKYKKKIHKECNSHKFGRFFIDVHNHIFLGDTKKTKKYIFVVNIGSKRFWKVRSFKFVDKLIDRNKIYQYIRLRDIFYEYDC